ncbi:MAG TPA: CocE/NonD family hydrolase [Myxococcota bacterium]|nr:CocE/NonD family hydrolase [Myxococcota bacterium]
MSAWHALASSALRALARRQLALPAPQSEVVSAREWVALADGTRLETLVVRPREAARGSLLVRSAASLEPRQPLSLLAGPLAEQGLAVAIQECRGLRDSEGKFAPFAHEASDGADAIHWLTAQPWFAAPLQLAGFGYGGYAAFAALARSPAPIERLFVGHASRDPYAWLHAGGALQLEAAFSLAFALAGAEQSHGEALSLERALRHRPLREADRVGMRRLDWLREWLAHPARDAFWEAKVAPLPARPPHALLLAEWNHPALAAQLADYAALAAASEQAGAGGAALEIGAAGSASRRQSLRRIGEALRTAIRFLLPDADVRRAPVRVFDGGAQRWREGAPWPPAGTVVRRLHLRGDGRAQGVDGDGRLESEAPGAFEPSDRFAYDPADATPSDDSRAERGDVLCFETPPLAAALALAGAVHAELYVASDAPVTDFCARLVAVDAEGRETALCEGIARGDAQAVEAGAWRVVVACGSACWRIAAGGRLRLEIASASHPRFDRGPNTSAAPADAGADGNALARQTLFHDAAHASCLEFEASEA